MSQDDKLSKIDAKLSHEASKLIDKAVHTIIVQSGCTYAKSVDVVKHLAYQLAVTDLICEASSKRIADLEAEVSKLKLPDAMPRFTK